MDYRRLLYGPIYTVFAVNARIITDGTDGKEKFIRVCDLTVGVDSQGNIKGGHFRRNAGAEVGEYTPAATVRPSELASNGILTTELEGSELQFNQKAWEVISWKPKPSPRGTNDGELLLTLSFLHDLEAESEVPSELPSESEIASELPSESTSESESEGFAAHDFTFPTPLLQWTINHNLGYNPSVYTYDLAGEEVEGSVLHTSLNQVVITFTVATAGTARLI